MLPMEAPHELQPTPLIPPPGGRKNHSFMSEQYRDELELRRDVDRLKNVEPYRQKYESEPAQQLSQAIDILWRLQSAAYKDASRVGYEKLRSAKLYLDRLLKEHFTEQ